MGPGQLSSVRGRVELVARPPAATAVAWISNDWPGVSPLRRSARWFFLRSPPDAGQPRPGDRLGRGSQVGRLAGNGLGGRQGQGPNPPRSPLDLLRAPHPLGRSVTSTPRCQSSLHYRMSRVTNRFALLDLMTADRLASFAHVAAGFVVFDWCHPIRPVGLCPERAPIEGTRLALGIGRIPAALCRDPASLRERSRPRDAPGKRRPRAMPAVAARRKRCRYR